VRFNGLKLLQSPYKSFFTSSITLLNTHNSSLSTEFIMASNPPAACCATGFKHEGTPVGEVKNIDGGQ
jgi:hypothetical protein